MNEPWLQRWHEGRIGWHQTSGNASLRQHWQNQDCRVLVPLCGKSPDLLWLADNGNEVIGVELSEVAIRAFFAEHDLSFTQGEDQLPFFKAVDKPITIYCGDYFDLRSLQCDAHYDRGALVALPADVRPRYAAQTNRLTSSDARRLVITLDYDQDKVSGPPFSVSDEELLSYWSDLDCVENIDDLPNGPPHFRESGLTTMFEKVWQN
jgi:thiopurine S-methyltransferase